MRCFMLLARVQLLALLNSLSPVRSHGRKRGATRIILIIAAMFLLIGIGVIYMAGLGLGLASMGLSSAIPAIATVLGGLAGVVFTFMKANGTLFGASDHDLVMSLPISRRTVVASRMAALFCSATALGAVFMVPLYAVYFSVAGVDAIALVAATVGVLLAPAIPTSAAIILSFALTTAAARFRHANLVYIVFAIAASVVLVVGVYGLSFSMNTGTAEDTGRALAAMGGAVALVCDGMVSAYPPAGLAMRAVTDGNVLALLAFVALSLAVPILCLEVVQRAYPAINGLLAAGGVRGRADAARALSASRRASSPFRALVVKELRTQVGIPAYAINCLFGYVLMIVLAVALVVIDARGVLAAGALGSGALDPESLALGMDAGRLFLLVPWVMAFCAIASPAAAVAVSLEGRSAWIMATLPVSPRAVLGAKLASNALSTAAVLVVSSAILLAGGQVDVLGALECLVLGFGVPYAFINAGMALDARRPNYAWSNAQEVVKRSLPIMVTVLGGMVAIFALGTASIALAVMVGDAASHALMLACGAVGIAAGQFIFRCTCETASFHLA